MSAALIAAGSCGASTGASIATKKTKKTMMNPTVPVLLLMSNLVHLLKEEGLFLVKLLEASLITVCDWVNLTSPLVVFNPRIQQSIQNICD